MHYVSYIYIFIIVVVVVVFMVLRKRERNCMEEAIYLCFKIEKSTEKRAHTHIEKKYEKEEEGGDM